MNQQTTTQWHAWEIHECDILVGPNLDTALDWYMQEMGVYRPHPEHVRKLPLTEEMTFTHNEDGNLLETPFTQTIEQMIAQHIRIGNIAPGIVWSSEW
jgi:hypothetical protein